MTCVRRPAKGAFPEGVTDYGDGAGLRGTIIFRQEGPAEHRPDTQRSEVRTGDELTRSLASRLARNANLQGGKPVCSEHRREDSIAVAKPLVADRQVAKELRGDRVALRAQREQHVLGRSDRAAVT